MLASVLDLDQVYSSGGIFYHFIDQDGNAQQVGTTTPVNGITFGFNPPVPFMETDALIIVAPPPEMPHPPPIEPPPHHDPPPHDGTPVPEPSTWALALGVLVVLIAWLQLGEEGR